MGKQEEREEEQEEEREQERGSYLACPASPGWCRPWVRTETSRQEREDCNNCQGLRGEEEVVVVHLEWEGVVLLETRSHGQRRSCPLLHEEVDPCARDRRGRDLSEEPDLLGRLLVEGRPWAVPPVRRRSVLVAHRGEGSSGTCEALRRKGGGVPRKQRRPHALSHVGGRRLDPAVVWRTISA